MRHVQNRHAEFDLDPFKLQAQLGAQLGVERRKRLVHEIDGGISNQSSPDCDALHFSAGKPRRPIPELASNVQELRRSLDALADGRFRNTMSRRAQRERKIVVDGQVRIQGVLLENESDIPRPRRVARHVPAIDGNRTLIGMLQPGNQSQRGCLSGAARPQQHDKLAIIDDQRQVAHRLGLAETLADMP